MAYVTPTLEFSRDPLSDTTPTWIDISQYLIEAPGWSSGKGSDLSGSEPGRATFRLKNVGRRFEPDYAAGAYYPDIDLLRRFRLTLTRDGGAISPEGIWYAVDYEVEYPGMTEYSEVVVSCVDGSELLSLDNLPLLDPPEATSYDDVINANEPVFFYPLSEPEGTKLVARVRQVKRWKAAGKRGPKPRKRLVTREDVAGVAGPAGTYKNLPTLGVPGLILGDPDTAVLFESAKSQYARVQLDQSDLIDSNRLSISCWIKPTTTTGTTTIVCGPNHAGIGNNVFFLELNSSGAPFASLFFNDGTSASATSSVTVADGATAHVGMSWDGSTIRVYVNGVETGATNVGDKKLRQGDAGEFLYIARKTSGGYFDGVIAKVAVFERALGANRFLAHYQAGAERGFPEQMAGERVAELVTSDLWGETEIQTGYHMVRPVMKYGQSPQEELEDAVAAEKPYSQFFFKRNGDPAYLGWEYKGIGLYNTVQATIGDIPGEIPYERIQLTYDNEVYNEVVVTHLHDHDGETSHTTSDSASQIARKRRLFQETGSSLAEHEDAQNVCHAILARWKTPAHRPVSVTLNGSKTDSLTQILARDIGDLVRVRRRGEGGTPIDRVTHIIGWEKSLNRSDHLGNGRWLVRCTWNLSRGFNAAPPAGTGNWRAGIVGFSEAGSTTRAA